MTLMINIIITTLSAIFLIKFIVERISYNKLNFEGEDKQAVKKEIIITDLYILISIFTIFINLFILIGGK